MQGLHSFVSPAYAKATAGSLLKSPAGAPEGIRTPDLCLRRATLYPAELRAHISNSKILLAVIYSHEIRCNGGQAYETLWGASRSKKRDC